MRKYTRSLYSGRGRSRRRRRRVKDLSREGRSGGRRRNVVRVTAGRWGRRARRWSRGHESSAAAAYAALREPNENKTLPSRTSRPAARTFRRRSTRGDARHVKTVFQQPRLSSNMYQVSDTLSYTLYRDTVINYCNGITAATLNRSRRSGSVGLDRDDIASSALSTRSLRTYCSRASRLLCIRCDATSCGQ